MSPPISTTPSYKTKTTVSPLSPSLISAPFSTLSSSSLVPPLLASNPLFTSLPTSLPTPPGTYTAGYCSLLLSLPPSLLHQVCIQQGIALYFSSYLPPYSTRYVYSRVLLFTSLPTSLPTPPGTYTAGYCSLLLSLPPSLLHQVCIQQGIALYFSSYLPPYSTRYVYSRVLLFTSLPTSLPTPPCTYTAGYCSLLLFLPPSLLHQVCIQQGIALYFSSYLPPYSTRYVYSRVLLFTSLPTSLPTPPGMYTAGYWGGGVQQQKIQRTSCDFPGSMIVFVVKHPPPPYFWGRIPNLIRGENLASDWLKFGTLAVPYCLFVLFSRVGPYGSCAWSNQQGSGHAWLLCVMLCNFYIMMYVWM